MYPDRVITIKGTIDNMFRRRGLHLTEAQGMH